MKDLEYQCLLGAIAIVSTERPSVAGDVLELLGRMASDGPLHPEDVPMADGVTCIKEHVGMIGDATTDMQVAAKRAITDFNEHVQNLTRSEIGQEEDDE